MTNLGGADPRLLERLREMQQRFEGVNESLADPDVIQNVDRLRVLGQERAELEPVVRAADELLRLVEEHEGASELLREASDQELRDMAGEEVASLEARIESLGAEACLLLIPKDPLDDRAAVVEIRAGTGGDEAGLFANDLFRMYQRVAEREGWTVELMNRSEGIPGSLKEAIFTVRGKGVYGRLRYESGVHRVQRVPETESQGRIHTSAATVAVLPEADEVDLAIDAKDLRYDVFRSSGPGGQSVNTTDSAVRITRFILQESVGQKVALFQSKYICTILVVFFAYLIGATDGWEKIWPIFGATNQLIAAIALFVVATWLMAINKPTKFALYPAIFMVVTTIGALSWQSYRFYTQPEPNIFLGTAAIFLIFLALFVGYEGLGTLSRREKVATAPA